MTKYQYSADWIYKLEDKQHWLLYWNQVDLLLKTAKKSDTILEIGKGSGFTANYLKSKGFKVSTIDIDAEKKPDIVAIIVTYPFSDNYDYILAFEVIEHIPYEEMQGVMKKLSAACRKEVIISIPRNEKIWVTVIIQTLLFNKTLSFATIRNKLTTPNHFWEIDYKGYTLNKFLKFISESGFKVSEKRKVGANLFFKLAKKEI